MTPSVRGEKTQVIFWPKTATGEISFGCAGPQMEESNFIKMWFKKRKKKKRHYNCEKQKYLNIRI